MSLIQELGAQLRAASDELPTAQVTIALERLRSATELLMWVREASVDPIGVPQLGNALEHAERASAALRLAQDTIAAYLATIGLTGDASQAPDRDWRAGLAKTDEQPGTTGEAPPPERLGGWWRDRVAQLTGEQPPDDARAGGAEPQRADTAELLRQVASGVRAGDRARLGRDLHAVNASTGLALSAVTPPVLHRLAGDLLGHEPGPDDVARLRTAASGRVSSLLPGTPPAVLDTLIERICRAPQPAGRPAAHPADNAVTSSVLTGVLLARLGRDPGTLDPSAPEPLRRPADTDQDSRG